MLTDIVSLLILLGFLQGLILFLILVSQGRQSKSANIWLIGILIFLLWTQIEFFLVRNRIRLDLFLFYGTRLGSWLVLGPMVLFYTRHLIGEKKETIAELAKHFWPSALFTLVIPLLIPSLLPDRAIHYGILSLLKYYGLGTTPLQAAYSTLFILQFAHLLVYLFWSQRLVTRFSDKLKQSYSNIDRINYSWLRNILTAFLVILISVSTFLTVLFAFNIYEREFDYLYALPVALTIYLMVFKIIRQPEIIRTSEPVTNGGKYSRSSLKPAHAEAYHDKLLQFMNEEKPYLNPDLKLADLADSLDIHPHHLSQVLNDRMQMSFFDFVNKYRVEEAKDKLRSKNGETILQIAYAVGFNNKASFNKYFKKLTGLTPSQFAAQ